jgi:hypothetical protein
MIYNNNMEHRIQLFEEFNKNKQFITLFRGQSDRFFNKSKETGYFKIYKMFYLTPYIDSAYFYTNPGYSNIREILVFRVPNNIARINGAYIDRLGIDTINKLKQEGYSGVTSNIGELSFDKDEVGMFNLYSPIDRFQTQNGKFSDIDLYHLSKLGLSKYNIDSEKLL